MSFFFFFFILLATTRLERRENIKRYHGRGEKREEWKKEADVRADRTVRILGLRLTPAVRTY